MTARTRRPTPTPSRHPLGAPASRTAPSPAGGAFALAGDIALAVGGALRLTRFITADSLGEWLILRPARRWAFPAEEARRQEAHDYVVRSTEEPADAGGALGRHTADWLMRDLEDGAPMSTRARAVSGLECPHCVGFWIGAAVLVSLVVARRFPAILPLWRLGMGALGLSYATGHASARLD